MRKILAVDTTGERFSMALGEGDAIWSASGAGKRPHDERLFPELRKLLDRADWRLKDLDAVAVASGPGRFTGIRIGMTFAAILGKVIRRPVLAISHLEALAHRALAGPKGSVCIVLSVGLDCYAQAFVHRAGRILPREEAAWIKAADLPIFLHTVGKRPVIRIEKFDLKEMGLAVNLIGPAVDRLKGKRHGAFKPLYLKPANFQHKAVDFHFTHRP